jgi:U3 small nucleolar RNA-associated protein 14
MTYMSETETGNETKTEETVEKANSPIVVKYNKLVEEAIELGMKGYRPLASRFRDTATGEARVAALESSIKAFKDGQRAEERQPGPEVQPQEEASMANSTTARKTKTVTKGKGKAKGVTKSKAKASDNARRKVAAEKPVRNGIVGIFGTREGSLKEKLLLTLSAKMGKPVPVGEVLKALYGKEADDNRGALQGVKLGIEGAIRNNKLSYELVSDGRGDEATIALVKK